MQEIILDIYSPAAKFCLLSRKSLKSLYYTDTRRRSGEILVLRKLTMASLKQIAMQLCTCTWIEIMTGAGIVLYMLYLGNFMLAGITAVAFAPLILFHFAMTKLPKSNVDWRPRSRMVRLH